MSHTIHDIGVASQIGKYSDAIEVGANLRWLVTSGTPGLSTECQRGQEKGQRKERVQRGQEPFLEKGQRGQEPLL